ncbi:MAG TPA: DinB family protein [Gemmatimonadales bacterium]|jgi:uncharacterized damage-inducible protein DinB|nr:DinB family protein [Gemmatimonadales bacterium]
MRSSTRAAAAAAALIVALVPSARAQAGGVIADLIKDVAQAEQKLVGLAKAMPESTWTWRPGTGVRTVGEVFQHVAADNYFLPTAVGVAAPASTGIKAGDYKATQAFESRKATRDEAISDLERSLAHLKQAMQQTTAANLNESLTIFGMTMTRQQYWILATTHLHEHLGQAIAYARSNGVVPPWSR